MGWTDKSNKSNIHPSDNLRKICEKYLFTKDYNSWAGSGNVKNVLIKVLRILDSSICFFKRYFLCVLRPPPPKTLTIFLCIENNLLGSVKKNKKKVNFMFKSSMKKNVYHFLKVFISLARWAISNIFCFKLNEVESQTKPTWLRFFWIKMISDDKVEILRFIFYKEVETQ